MEEIAAQIPAGARLVDVGTDHGHLPIWLLLQGRITRAIATDVREGPLSRARENAARYGCALELRLGDGLAPVRQRNATPSQSPGWAAKPLPQF